MKKILDLISEEVVKAFEEAGYSADFAKVTLSNRPDLCEYQCNGALAAAKTYKKAPIMIANDVVAKLKENGIFQEVQAVSPGFINLKLSGDYLAEYLKQMQADENLSVEKAEHPKKIILDYGGPNVAKPLHVGHLRSAIIGESIKRLGRFMGHEMIGDVHLGDWGLQTPAASPAAKVTACSSAIPTSKNRSGYIFRKRFKPVPSGMAAVIATTRSSRWPSLHITVENTSV